MSVLFDPATQDVGARQVHVTRRPRADAAAHGAARKPQTEFHTRVSDGTDEGPRLVRDSGSGNYYEIDRSTPAGLLTRMIIQMGGAPQSVFKGMYIDQRI